jgi:DNA-binding NtrC family response regulator
VAVNCGAISESLMEAELFGHARGAFTGAVKEHKGCFEQADGGTLFLDEIGDMPLPMQVKLLRTIQERAIVRVGGEKPVPVNIRLVCATHRNLKKMVEEGRFREDLYYRIHVVQIDIPPLRERREDILWLADRFLSEFSTDGQNRSLDASAEDAMLAADWPGNARELRHCLERCCILSPSLVLSAAALCGDSAPSKSLPTQTLADHVAASERRRIVEALAANQGRIAETAMQLGISRKNLWEKMKKHEIGAQAGEEA